MIIAALVFSSTTPSIVSVSTLLPEMTSFDHLTARPNPFYQMAQSSSYDRRSNPGPNSDPFANGDAGNFLRTETTANGKEYVMADLKGPGAVVRVWSANPAGTIRFYFDGEKTARLAAKMADLLQGRVKPFDDPFSYNSANGTNLYFPFPYAKSLKITADDSDNNGARNLYYHVGYRTYGASTKVETYDPNISEANLAEMRKVRLGLRYPSNATAKMAPTDFQLGGGKEWSQIINGSGVVKELKIQIPFPLVQNIRAMDWTDAYQPHNVLRNLLLKIEVNGNKVIETPVGDFFGTSPGLNAFQTLPFEVRADGTMICRLPMPHQSQFKITLINSGPVELHGNVTIANEAKNIDPKTYALHAEWSVDKGSTRPFRDMNFLNTTGEGMWVGSNMHISNPSPAWWGEGDEKVYVDGEKFPSTFGTGTEDYYGYAWSAPIVFQHPYNAQPRSDGPGNFGHSVVERYHILDPIPFSTSFKFDMEMWHWEEVVANYTHTAFWYGPANIHPPKTIDRSLLAPMELKPPQPVKGAIEGETMRIVSKGSGVTENQGGFWGLSGGEQLWWQNAKVGDKLQLQFPVADDGTYDIVGNFCHAKDYGKHRLSIDGQPLGDHDFYATGIKWTAMSLGQLKLTKGTHELTVECLGKNDAAVPGQMFGLDYLLLQPVR